MQGEIDSSQDEVAGLIVVPNIFVVGYLLSGI
jgi:hypothetical protein